MTAAPLAQRLRTLRVDLSVSTAGRLHIEAPVGTLTDELRATIAAHRDELIALLEGVPPTSARAPGFSATSLDPRPDLTDDAAPWASLLALAWERDRRDRCGVYATLHGMRCLGVQLTPAGDTLRLHPRSGPPGHPPRWVTPDQYQEERRRWLEPHREAVIALLASVGTTTTGAD